MALLLRKTKKALSGCRRFSSHPLSYSFGLNGWEFEYGTRPFEEPERQKFASSMKDLPVPRRFGDEDLSITHLFTGIKMCFNPLDALKKYREEWETGNPLQSEFPTYASPFRPTPESFDSAYTGRIFMTTPGEESYTINPTWEYVDWNTACERVFWLSSRDHWPFFKPCTKLFGVSGCKEPHLLFIKVGMLFAHCGRRIQSFEQNTKTRLQLLPLFGVPQGKRVYLSGAKEDIEAAKRVLAYDYLGRGSRPLKLY